MAAEPSKTMTLPELWLRTVWPLLPIPTPLAIDNVKEKVGAEFTVVVAVTVVVVVVVVVSVVIGLYYIESVLVLDERGYQARLTRVTDRLVVVVVAVTVTVDVPLKTVVAVRVAPLQEQAEL